MSTRYWRHLTDEQQESLAIVKIEEVQECAKEIAHEQLDDMLPEELAFYVLLAEEDDDAADDPERIAAWVAEHFPDYTPELGG